MFWSGFEIAQKEDIDETLELEINESLQENTTKEETFGDNDDWFDIDDI